MALFRAVLHGAAKNPVSRLGHASSGMVAEVNTWDCGVTVEAFARDDGRVVFSIWATHGSNASGSRQFLGVINHYPAGHPDSERSGCPTSLFADDSCGTHIKTLYKGS